MADAKTFGVGSFRGVHFTSEPFDESPDTLNQAYNVYIPDPVSGSAAYSRPGFQELVEKAGEPQLLFTHTGTNGTSYDFAVVAGALYRLDAGVLTNVTPTNLYLPTTGFVYAKSLGDTIMFNNGVTSPVGLTSVSSTPVVATYVPYGSAITNLYISSANPARIENFSFPYNIQGTFGSATAATLIALTAGTIPLNTWAAYVIYNTGPATFVVIPATANYTTGYATEALAIAAATTAGLPLVSTRWYVGMVTIQSPIGASFIVNTADLNTAQDVNFYEGYPPPWTAYGQPVIYTGAVFFITKQVPEFVPPTTYTMVNARSAITWSEPNLPMEGYQQTDYDNVWELTQTSSDPLYALAPTNDALYYFRQFSIGGLSGAPNINFQNTATHDVVAGNIGCVSPNSVHVYLNFVYFLDALGRPYRFSVGGSPQPLWQQLRQWFDDFKAELATELIEDAAWAVVEPNLNLYVCRLYLSDGTSIVHVFDAATGVYAGQWILGNGGTPTLLGTPTVGGVWAEVDSGSDYFGSRRMVWGIDRAVGDSVIAALSLREEDIWADSDDDDPILFISESGWLGFSLTFNTQVTALRAATFGAAYNTLPVDDEGVILNVSTTQTDATILPSTYVIPPRDTLTDYIARYVIPLNNQVMGRGGRIVLVGYTEDEQVLIYRMEMDVVISKGGIENR